MSGQAAPHSALGPRRRTGPAGAAEDDPLRDWECRSPMQVFHRLLDRVFVGPAPAYATDLGAVLEEERPDLVVCSFFALGAMTAAEAAGVPFDVLHPNVYLLPAPGMPPFGLGLRPATGPLGRTRDRLINGFANRQWAKGLPRLNDLRASLGLDPVTSLFDQVHRARRELVLTSQSFDFTGQLPDNASYVGAVLDDPAWATTAPWTPPPGDAPLVLVTMSTTFQDHAGCLQRIIDALGTLPVRGLVTTGPALDPTEVTAPGNVTVVRAAPHSKVLADAAAIVTHGGHGTVVRGLAAGVPLIVLPHGRDQADNAVRVTARGAGLTVKRSASPKVIARAVSQLLDDPRYAEAAESLGAVIRCDTAEGRLLGELESIASHTVTAER